MLIALRFRQWLRHSLQTRGIRRHESRDPASSFIARHELGYPELLEDRTLLTSAISLLDGTLTIDIGADGEQTSLTVSGGNNLSITSTDAGGTTADTAAQALGFAAMTAADATSTGSLSGSTTVNQIVINGSAGTQTIMLGDGAFPALTAGENSDLELITVTGDVTLGSSDLHLLATQTVALTTGSNITTVDGNVTLKGNVAATTSVDSVGVSLTNAVISTSGTGNISLTGRGGDGTGADNRGVLLTSGTLIESTSSDASAGRISIGGIGGSGTQYSHGVEISEDNSTVSTIVGGITIHGTGGNGASGMNNGVLLSDDVSIRSTGTGATAGAIEISGSGGAAGPYNRGIEMFRAGTAISSVDGAISVTGDGGGSSGVSNIGVAMFQGSRIESTGNGASAATISITGVGGTGTSFNRGIAITGNQSAVSSVDGDIFISGTGGNGTGDYNSGILLMGGSQVTSTGISSDAATIILTGRAGTGHRYHRGVAITGADAGVTTVAGDIIISGTAGSGTGAGQHGVFVFNNALIASTGTGSAAGNIQIDGTGGSGAQTSSGVTVMRADARVISIDGSISITGNDGLTGGETNRGLELIDNARVESTGSSVSVVADDGVNVDGSSRIVSATGTVIEVDLDSDDLGTGSVVRIAGTVHSINQTTITTGSDSDSILYTPAVLTGVTEINSGDGNDTVSADGAADGVMINGGNGDDLLTGSAFDDVLNGEDDNDTLVGLGGLDRLTGGPGTNSFENVARPLIVDTTTDVDDGNYSAGNLSLREAVRLANESVDLDETISFDAALNGSTIILTGGELPILNPVLINGPGLDLLTINAEDLSRVFNVDDGNSDTKIGVSISGLTLTRGMTVGDGGVIATSEDLTLNELTITGSAAVHGGGIHNSGTLTVTDSTISGNSSEFGGGIFDNNATLIVTTSTIADNIATSQGAGIRLGRSNVVITDSAILRNTGAGEGGGISSYQSNLTVKNSTLFGNEARGDGGGIFVGSGGSAQVVQSTISGNRSGVSNSGGSFIFGGGIRKRSGSLTVLNTIVAGNFQGTGMTPNDISGLVDIGRFNLIGNASSHDGLADGVDGNIVGNQGVGVLDLTGVLDPTPMDHGGPTVTFALPFGSIAIDAGNNTHAPSLHDQRGPGFDRIIDGNNDDATIVDIGSFEFIPPPMDFGDAPDVFDGTSGGDYQTRTGDNGPSHTIVNGLKLGASVDADSGILNDTNALADDVDGGADDEDGVLNPLELLGTIGAAPTITLLATNTTGSAAMLSGWIDYNYDGIFDNTTERAQIVVPDGSTDSRFTLVFPVVPSNFAGETYARFRLSTDVAGENSTGAASDGEVEDYTFLITAPSDGTVDSLIKIANDTNGGPMLANGDNFGASITSIGDLDGDGIDDLAVGAFGDDGGVMYGYRGAVHVLFMNPDRTVRSSTKIGHNLNGGPDLDDIADLAFFGKGVAGLGDLDGDGIPDLAVGARGNNFSGAVYILMLNSDGTAKSSMRIGDQQNGGPDIGLDYFGSSVASLGDLDGDGVVDLAIGAIFDDTGGDTRGAVHVLFLNSDGTVKSSTKIASDTNGGPTLLDEGRFGSAVANLGDLDGDGVADIAVGARTDNPGGGGIYEEPGAVYVLLLNSDGSVKSSTKIASETNGGPTLGDYDNFGSGVAGLGDLDGDGIVDLAVGAYSDDLNGSAQGTLHILLLNNDGTVRNSQRIDGNSGGGPELSDDNEFGAAVANLGDVNGDGITDLAVGASGDTTGDSGAFAGQGAVYTLFLSTSAEPQPASFTLPETGSYEVLMDNSDLLIRLTDGTEMFRVSTALTSLLTILGSGGDDVVTVLDSGGTVSTPISFMGSDGDDQFDGSLATGATTLDGGAGNDTLIGGSADDLVIGGAGTNQLTGGSGTDTLRVAGNAELQITASAASGDGDDTHNGFEQAVLEAGSNNNRLDASEATIPVTLFGGDGNDTLLGGSQNDSLDGGAGIDFADIAGTNIVLTNESAPGFNGDVMESVEGVRLVASDRDSVINASAYTRGPVTIVGSSGDDTLMGGAGDDVIIAGSGRDVVNGGLGDDLIMGGAGSDDLSGDSGNDTISGGRGQDVIDGGENADNIFGGGSSDTVRGSDGDDIITGGSGRDTIDGDGGEDILLGNAGRDDLAGGLGNDTLNGDFRDDSFNQIVGRDLLIGGQRPSARLASISTADEVETKPELSLFLKPPAESSDSENIDGVFTESLLTELMWF